MTCRADAGEWGTLVKLDGEGAPFQIGAMVVGDGLLGILLAAKTHRAVALCQSGNQRQPWAHCYQQSPCAIPSGISACRQGVDARLR